MEVGRSLKTVDRAAETCDSSDHGDTAHTEGDTGPGRLQPGNPGEGGGEEEASAEGHMCSMGMVLLEVNTMISLETNASGLFGGGNCWRKASCPPGCRGSTRPCPGTCGTQEGRHLDLQPSYSYSRSSC